MSGLKSDMFVLGQGTLQASQEGNRCLAHSLLPPPRRNTALSTAQMLNKYLLNK